MIFTIRDLTFSVGDVYAEGVSAFLLRLIIAFLIFSLFWIVSRLFKKTIFPRLIKKLEGGKVTAFEILVNGFAKPLPMLIWVFGVYGALQALPWAPAVALTIKPILTTAFRIAVILCLTFGLMECSDLCGLIFKGASDKFELDHNATVLAIIENVFKVIVVAFGVITILYELDFNVTGLITGVGLVGLTVSLAAQDSAANLFSGLMILIEHPFGIGDWINVQGVEGTVEDLTLRSTKIRALDNSLYVLPNSSVTSATINNGTKREKRLYRFTLGTTYKTTRVQLEQLMIDIEALLKNQPEVQEDSVTVRLTGFGNSSIDILVSAYLFLPNMGDFLIAQNRLNLDLMDIMKKNGVEFAFPSTSIYIEKDGTK